MEAHGGSGCRDALALLFEIDAGSGEDIYHSATEGGVLGQSEVYDEIVEVVVGFVEDLIGVEAARNENIIN